MTSPSSVPTPGRRIAAIDVGSNSIRQIIADVRPDGVIDVVNEMKAHPRLGRGLGATGTLNTESMRLAIETLSRMATLAKQFGAQRVEAVATSAVRDATNAKLFIARVKRATGLKLRVLKGEDEARLSFRSALAHFDLGAGRAVILDIGGGSLELAFSAEGVVDRFTSLPLGAMRLTESFLTAQPKAQGRRPKASGPVPIAQPPEPTDQVPQPTAHSPKRLRKLRKAIRKAIKPVISARDWRGARVIGSGGTFTNLAGMYLHGKGTFTPQSVHETAIPRLDVEHLLDALVEMTDHERRSLPGLNPDRADIIVAGLAVVAEVLARVDARDVVVSRYGIREGLLLEAARVTPVVADQGEARDRSVRDLAERCHFEKKHSLAVQGLALRLFDSVAERLGLHHDERRILSDAALLHDIGYHINYDRHHKHSYHLILHAELLGVSPEEQVLIANVARYHRAAEPRKSQPNFGDLNGPLRARVKRLAAILRVADGFDRGHVSAVETLKVRWLDRALRITPVPARANANLRLEMWGAHRKSALLARVVGRPVEIVGPDGSVLSSAEPEAD